MGLFDSGTSSDDSFFNDFWSSTPSNSGNATGQPANITPKSGTSSGGFWSKFDASQLLDTGTKIFTTKLQSESNGQLAKAQQQKALADAQRTNMLKTWGPIALVGIVVVAILGFVFRK